MWVMNAEKFIAVSLCEDKVANWGKTTYCVSLGTYSYVDVIDVFEPDTV